MEKMFYIVLGSILATLGGFIHLWYQRRQTQKKEDKNALIQSLDILDALKRMRETPKAEKYSFEYFDELNHLSFKLQCRENENIALDIRKFVKEYRGKDPKINEELHKKIDTLRSKIENRLSGEIKTINKEKNK